VTPKNPEEKFRAGVIDHDDRRTEAVLILNLAGALKTAEFWTQEGLTGLEKLRKIGGTPRTATGGT